MKHLTVPASGTISIIPCGALGPLGVDIRPMSRCYGGGRGLVDQRLVDRRLVDWRSVDWRLVDWRSVDWRLVDWRSVDWRLVDWKLVDWGLVDWGCDRLLIHSTSEDWRLPFDRDNLLTL